MLCLNLTDLCEEFLSWHKLPVMAQAWREDGKKEAAASSWRGQDGLQRVPHHTVTAHLTFYWWEGSPWSSALFAAQVLVSLEERSPLFCLLQSLAGPPVGLVGSGAVREDGIE